MTLILIILLLLILFGGGYGYRTGYVAYNNPIGIILLVVLIIIIFGLISPRFGWWTY